jgi:hypothetical protein
MSIDLENECVYDSTGQVCICKGQVNVPLWLHLQVTGNHFGWSYWAYFEWKCRLCPNMFINCLLFHLIRLQQLKQISEL